MYGICKYAVLYRNALNGGEMKRKGNTNERIIYNVRVNFLIKFNSSYWPQEKKNKIQNKNPTERYKFRFPYSMLENFLKRRTYKV